MDNIYDTLAKLNKVANAPEIVKEDSNALMKKGLEDLMKKTKFNKDADYKPFSDKQSPDGLPEKKKDDKMFEAPSGQTKHELIRQLFKTHFGQPQYNELTGGRSGMRRLKIITGTTRGTGYEFANDGPGQDTSDFEKAIGKAGLSGDVRVKSNGTATTVLYPDAFRMQSLAEADLVEKESDVERDDRAEKAGREVKRDAKYDHYRHAGKDGKDVTKDIEYDEKHDKDGMHESSGTLKDAARQGVMARLAELAGLPAKEIEEALGTPQDIANKIMSENPINEASVGDAIKHAYDSVYEFVGKYDDAALEYLDNNAPTFGEMFEKYEDLDVMISNCDDATCRIIADELYDVADELESGVLESVEEGMKSKTFPTVFNDEDVMVANDPDSALELIADEVPEHVDMYVDAIRKGDYESLLDALDGFGYKMKYEEGNEFSGERDKAIKAGKNDFTVDGKTYPVKGDKNESLEESDIDQIADVGKVYSKINKMKMDLVDKGMEPEDAQDEACEKYDCDPSMYDKYVEMKRDEREGTKKESKELDEGAVKDMMQDVEEGMDKKEFEKKYPGQDYDGIKKDIEDRMDETTSSGSVATSEGAGKPLYQNASVYESNEIVKRAKQLNEDMSISVNAGTNAEPSININASGEEAAKLAQLLKLAGMGMAQPGYGEVQVDVAEDQEFANGADDTNTMDTEYMTQDIAGGLNGPKKMAYPKVAGGDNPMSVLGESELNEVSEDHLMKLYQAYKAK